MSCQISYIIDENSKIERRKKTCLLPGHFSPTPANSLSKHQEFFAIQSSPISRVAQVPALFLTASALKPSLSPSLAFVECLPKKKDINMSSEILPSREVTRYPLMKSDVGEDFGTSNIQPFQAFHTSHTAPFAAPAPFGARSASLV